MVLKYSHLVHKETSRRLGFFTRQICILAVVLGGSFAAFWARQWAFSITITLPIAIIGLLTVMAFLRVFLDISRSSSDVYTSFFAGVTIFSVVLSFNNVMMLHCSLQSWLTLAFFGLVLATNFVFNLLGKPAFANSQINYRQEPLQYMQHLNYLQIVCSTLKWCALASILSLVLVSKQSWGLFIGDLFLNTFWSLVTIFIIYLYQAYISIGCLIVDVPLSSASTSPFETLISGLKDTDCNVQLLAFQELLFISKTPEIKYRFPLYQLNNWDVILDIIGSRLSQSAKNCRKGMPYVNKAVKNDANKKTHNVSLFGNLSSYNNATSGNDDITGSLYTAPSTASFPAQTSGSDNSVPVEQEQEQEVPKNSKYQDQTVRIIKLLDDKINEMFSKYKQKFVPVTSIINYWIVRYQTRKRLNVAEGEDKIIQICIESLSEMLIHCKGEDTHDKVFNTLTDALILLAKVYKGTSQFLIYYGSSFNDNKMVQMNLSSLKFFYKLIIFYNSVLNDLILPPEVFRLAKWCTDYAIELELEDHQSSRAAISSSAGDKVRFQWD